jgi:3-mercaptopyruvate sulfurtransferase SseA
MRQITPPFSGSLVDADWVEASVDTPGVVLVEVDEDISAYDKGHIRGRGLLIETQLAG